MYLLRIASTAAVAAIMFTASARAGDWVAVATTCAPDESSTGKFEDDFGRFQFLGTNTGSVDARCNVTNPQDNNGNPGWNGLEVSYEDPDGYSTDYQVVAALRRVDKFTGLSYLLATYDSNTFTNGQHVRNVGFNHVFDFTNNAYYVGISVKRNSAALSPKIQRVRLYLVPTP